MIFLFRSEDATCNDKIVKAGVDGSFFPLVSHLFSASTVGVGFSMQSIIHVLSWGRDLIVIMLLEYKYILNHNFCSELQIKCVLYSV